MTARERTLLMIVLGLGVAVIGIFLFENFFHRPYSNLSESIRAREGTVAEKEQAINKERDDVARLQKNNPRLLAWDKISLPDNRDNRPEEVKRLLSKLQITY